MRLKPKTTVGKTRALLYKRFIGIEQAFHQLDQTIVYYAQYRTDKGGIVTRSWYFDRISQQFIDVPSGVEPDQQIRLTVGAVYTSGQYYFVLHSRRVGQGVSYTWERSETLPDTAQTLRGIGFANVGKYQTNKYYFAGSFDFMVKGSMEGTTTQYIKGNIAPLTSFNIVHYNDYVQLSPDDLVVIDGHLYSVENPDSTPKHQPKDYFIYHATLNSIL